MLNASSHPIQQALNHFNVVLPASIILPEHSVLTDDSRTIKKGDIFVAVIGAEQDGRDFINSAINAGASFVICHCEDKASHGQLEQVENTEIPLVHFYQLDQSLFTLAKLFYQSPQDKMTMIGITGTNGKTSTSQLIAQLFEQCNKKCAVIGTNGVGFGEKLQPSKNTTPGAFTLHQLLAQFKQQQAKCVAMEVSSHALEQKRVIPQLIDIAVFTNISRDHLDYHHTMENYTDAKYKLFSQSSGQVAIVNGDDIQAKNWLKTWPEDQPVVVCSQEQVYDQYDGYVYAHSIALKPSGAEFIVNTHIGSATIKSRLIGHFNIDNLLAAIAVLVVDGISLSEISEAVKNATPIAGRMETFIDQRKPTTVVDYAHTPDALKNALIACKEHCVGQLWLVFGCGGDRDKGKRPIMGAIAEQYADHIVLTNDNPRSESPMDITNDILAGCMQKELVEIEFERKQAFTHVMNKAKQKDVVLLAGKGHEDYIIVGNNTLPYNERAMVQRYYNEGVLS